jgi:hypothetical protein
MPNILKNFRSVFGFQKYYPYFCIVNFDTAIFRAVNPYCRLSGI